MGEQQDPMQRLRIATPCPAKWENMAGDERVRYCALCDLNVYNFASMTRSEVGELLATAEGRICARLYQRADGTLLTSDCPSGLQAVRRRRSRWRTAALAALISLSTLTSSCTTSTKPRSKKQTSRMKLAIERIAIAQDASLVGVVRDEASTPLPGVSVLVRDEATHHEFNAVTDGTGAFSITSLRDGTYRVEVTLPGLEPMVREHLPLKQSEVARAQVTLRFSAAMITVGELITIEPTITNDALTTTFSQDFLSKIPLGN